MKVQHADTLADLKSEKYRNEALLNVTAWRFREFFV